MPVVGRGRQRAEGQGSGGAFGEVIGGPLGSAEDTRGAEGRCCRRSGDSAVASRLTSAQLAGIATVAKLLGVGLHDVRHMVAGCRAPVLKAGWLVRVDLEEIRRWIEEQCRPPVADSTPRRASGRR